jgi:ABC-type enterochelin transport system substrate-binding protein
MKKVFALLAIAGMFSFVACGPKAEEQAAETTEQVMEEAAPAEAAVETAPVEEAAPAATDSTAAATPAEGTAQ